MFLCQAADRRDVVCHLIGRGCGMTRVQSNVQCAQAAPSGKLVVIKLHARFHFGCVGFETWSRTQLGHTQSFTHKHIILSRASFKHNFITHNSSHTTFLNLSMLHHLLRFSFLPRPASTFVSAHWKKLICGVFRSFNFPHCKDPKTKSRIGSHVFLKLDKISTGPVT